MIDKKDLMIGNYLKCEDNGSIFDLTIDIFCDKNFQNHLSCGDINPIPLTEEIFLKCGFEQVDIFAEYRKGSITLGLVAGNENQWQLMINGVCTSVILNHLHGLQNVYKIFEKQELDIKL